MQAVFETKYGQLEFMMALDCGLESRRSVIMVTETEVGVAPE